MAKIIIELNTDDGDTVDTIMNAFFPLRKVDTSPPSPTVFTGAAPNFTPKPGGVVVGRTETMFDAAPLAPVQEIPPEAFQPSQQTAAPAEEMIDASRLGPMDGDRKRGHGRAPSKRRTNAQIAEDNRWFAYLEEVRALNPPIDPLVFRVAPQDEPTDPEPEGEPSETETEVESEIDPEIATQDAADEAAEAAKTEEAPRTTLQRAIAAYVKKFGAAVATSEMQKILGKPSRDLTDVEIPDAVTRLTAAMNVEPESTAKFTPVETAPAETPIDPASVTIEDVRAEMMKYGVKYDGTSDPKKMKFTAEDMPWVLQHAFSIGVVSPERIPKNEKHGYYKALLAIRDAIEKNPRNRMLKSFRG